MRASLLGVLAFACVALLVFYKLQPPKEKKTSEEERETQEIQVESELADPPAERHFSFFPYDVTSQRAAENMLAAGTPLEEVKKLSEVALIIVKGKNCEFGNELESLLCQTDPSSHPYYTYNLDTLEGMAYADPVAAYVYAERARDMSKAIEYNLRSSIISGKVGPLLRVRTAMSYYVYDQYSARTANGKYDLSDREGMYRRALMAGDRNTAALFALDAFAREMGIPNELYPQLPESVLQDASSESLAHFNHFRAFLHEETDRIGNEIGI